MNNAIWVLVSQLCTRLFKHHDGWVTFYCELIVAFDYLILIMHAVFHLFLCDLFDVIVRCDSDELYLCHSIRHLSGAVSAMVANQTRTKARHLFASENSTPK